MKSYNLELRTNKANKIKIEKVLNKEKLYTFLFMHFLILGVGVGDSYLTQAGMLVASLWGVNFGFLVSGSQGVPG